MGKVEKSRGQGPAWLRKLSARPVGLRWLTGADDVMTVGELTAEIPTALALAVLIAAALLF
jgi:hypothetical protein